MNPEVLPLMWGRGGGQSTSRLGVAVTCKPSTRAVGTGGSRL